MNATMKPKMSRWAVASLLLGAGIFLTATRALTNEIYFYYLTLGIGAIVSGHLALSRRGTSACTTFSRIMALVGLALGYGGMGLFLLLFLGIYVHLPGTNCGDGMLSNGKQIYYVSVYGFTDYDKKEGWPSSARFTNSTAFFTNLFSAHTSNEYHQLFDAPGFNLHEGTNAALNAENNAWCVVADLTDKTPDSVPFLLTRNVRAHSLADLRGRVGETLLNEPPYGKKGAVVVSRGGVSQMLKPDMLWSNILGGQTFTNRVLRP
jgi:hypothetical protein